MVAEASSTVPNGWLETTVASVASVRVGRQRSPSRQTGKFATKYIRAGNIKQGGLDLSDVLEMDFSPAEIDTYRLQPGDVVLSEASGSASQVGRAAIWRGEIPDCCFQNTVVRVRPHAVVAEFALLIFRHMAESGAFAQVARGVGIQHLGAGRFADMHFPLPPLAEQQRIVTEAERRLGEIQAAQRALESLLEKTAEQDRLILNAAVTGGLVELQSVIAARDGTAFEPASDLLRRYIADRDLSLFAVTDDDMAGIPVPDGWTMASVGRVGEVRLGRQRAPQFERGVNPTPYLRAANITTAGLDLDDVLQMDFTPDERQTYELKDGDVVLSEASGSPQHVGRASIWREEIAHCCFQNTVIRFRSGATSPGYALLVFRHMAETGAFARAARGVGIQHLGASRFSILPFPLPPCAEQERIVAEAETRLDRSEKQRLAAATSIARFDDMRREIWAAAASGRLVAQHPDEEPAEVMLARLGPPPEPQRASSSLPRKENALTKSPPGAAQTAPKIRPLVAVLEEAGRPVSAPDLFAAAGYDRDSAEDVERFYIALRDELDRTVELASDADENALVGLRHAS